MEEGWKAYGGAGFGGWPIGAFMKGPAMWRRHNKGPDLVRAPGNMPPAA